MTEENAFENFSRVVMESRDKFVTSVSQFLSFLDDVCTLIACCVLLATLVFTCGRKLLRITKMDEWIVNMDCNVVIEGDVKFRDGKKVSIILKIFHRVQTWKFWKKFTNISIFAAKLGSRCTYLECRLQNSVGRFQNFVFERSQNWYS